jgi:hypothetical protein
MIRLSGIAASGGAVYWPSLDSARNPLFRRFRRFDRGGRRDEQQPTTRFHRVTPGYATLQGRARAT